MPRGKIEAITMVKEWLGERGVTDNGQSKKTAKDEG